jgi:hypothetical protein
MDPKISPGVSGLPSEARSSSGENPRNGPGMVQGQRWSSSVHGDLRVIYGDLYGVSYVDMPILYGYTG